MAGYWSAAPHLLVVCEKSGVEDAVVVAAAFAIAVGPPVAPQASTVSQAVRLVLPGSDD